jgi:hypothetical protein
MEIAEIYQTSRKELPAMIKLMLQKKDIPNIQFNVEDPCKENCNFGCIMNVNFMFDKSEEDWKYFNEETYTEIKYFSYHANGPVYARVNSRGYMEIKYGKEYN